MLRPLVRNSIRTASSRSLTRGPFRPVSRSQSASTSSPAEPTSRAKKVETSKVSPPSATRPKGRTRPIRRFLFRVTLLGGVGYTVALYVAHQHDGFKEHLIRAIPITSGLLRALDNPDFARKSLAEVDYIGVARDTWEGTLQKGKAALKYAHRFLNKAQKLEKDDSKRRQGEEQKILATDKKHPTEDLTSVKDVGLGGSDPVIRRQLGQISEKAPVEFSEFRPQKTPTSSASPHTSALHDGPQVAADGRKSQKASDLMKGELIHAHPGAPPQTPSSKDIRIDQSLQRLSESEHKPIDESLRSPSTELPLSSSFLDDMVLSLDRMARKHGDPNVVLQLSKVMEDIKPDIERLYNYGDENGKRLQELVTKVLESCRDSLDTLLGAQNATLNAAKADAERLIATLKEDMVSEFRHSMEKQRQELVTAAEERMKEQEHWLKTLYERSLNQRLDKERAGRLAKLDELELSCKRLEMYCMEVDGRLSKAAHLADMTHALESLERKLFHDPGQKSGFRSANFVREWSLLRSLAGNDPLIREALDGVSEDIVENGISSLERLRWRLKYSVAPQVHKVALLDSLPQPEARERSLGNRAVDYFGLQVLHKVFPSAIEKDEVQVLPSIGFLSYSVAWAMSKLLGSVSGDSDIDEDRLRRDEVTPSHRMARAEKYLEEARLEDAGREVARLQGWPRRLAEGWLDECRQVLEVQTALEVVSTQVKLQALGKIRWEP